MDAFNASEPEGPFRATFEAMNGRLIARGVPSCPSECHCDAASRCGTPYTNESKKTLSKEELFQLRPGQPFRGGIGVKTDDGQVESGVRTPVPSCARKPATGCPPLPGDSGPCGSHEECMVIMALFAECGPDRTAIQRHVQLTARGYTAVTTSPNTTVSRLLQQHVESMRQRVQSGQPPVRLTDQQSTNNAHLQRIYFSHSNWLTRLAVRARAGRPINTWDPFYAAVFNASARQEIELSVRNVSGGVAVNETGKTPCAEAVLHEHAGEVDRFVSRGMPEMGGPAHPVPKGCPWHSKVGRVQESLGQ